MVIIMSGAVQSEVMHILPKRKRGPPPTLKMPTLQVSEVPEAPTTSTIIQISPNFYISGYNSATNSQSLVSEGITHILNLVGEEKCPNRFPGRFTYKNLKIPDNPKIDILFFIYFAIEFISSAIEHGGKVLVHCLRGISRAPTIACAFLMHAEGIGESEAFRRIKNLHPLADPNLGFMCQLRMFREREERKMFRYSEKYDMFINASGNGNLELMIDDDVLTLTKRENCRGRENDCGVECARLWEKFKGRQVYQIQIQ
ncbi:unnamed protein product [Blepharisma stoltei]|uniref:Dual specificity protein phosphatase n=1 Tax=Blepharisma stoltei TaxID=1481888 RepID=A0AAU9IKQ7_9CILI|nr:unnamed protein product [Blepharisma stoltei]